MPPSPSRPLRTRTPAGRRAAAAGLAVKFCIPLKWLAYFGQPRLSRRRPDARGRPKAPQGAP